MARKRSAPKRLRCPSCGREVDPGDGRVNFCPGCGADLRAPVTDRTAPDGLFEQVIADRYRLLDLLGEGGMGSVYKAEHIRMGKALALKVLRGDFAAEQGRVERFRAEARIVSRLSHPHTIAVFDFGEIEHGEGFYLAMEYVPGKDLARMLREAGRIPEIRAAEIGQQILGSLAEAHDAGVVHRDMKPGNVMLMQTRSGEDFVKVLDFGIAKLREDGQPAVSSTTSEAIVGTPSYLAPEQARGGPVDARTDLYAVGCLLHELVAGKPPFVAPSAMAVVSAHLNDEPPPLASIVPEVSRGFAEVVRRALRKRPEERFASADDMRDALLALGEPTPAQRSLRPSRPEVTGALRIASRRDFDDFERQVRSLRRSRTAAPLVAAVLAAGAATVAWRWTDLYSLIATRVPGMARLLPAALRPSGTYDGDEHEPNDVPARANVLPLPPGADGRPGGGVAIVRGHVGAKPSPTSGDVDIYRIDVPAMDARKVLVAEWHGEHAGEGIRGLDVSIALNCDAGGDPRTPAPLVAAADRGAAGQPETLVAAVEPGVHYLAVREKHVEVTGPIEKPTDPYVLEVRLADPSPGEEVEPNNEPHPWSTARQRYREWRAVAERNQLGEGTLVEGETSANDRDTYAVAPRFLGDAPRLVVAVPDPQLALVARRWVPDAEDLALLAPSISDRLRFEPEVEAAPGQAIAVALEEAPQPGAPVLVQVRGAGGRGRYRIEALGESASSGVTALSLVRALAEARPAQALEVAAAYAAHLPHAAGRNEVLLAAGRVAQAAAASLTPRDVGAYDRASQLLGAAVLDVAGEKVRYTGAFEALADEELTTLRLAVLASPCTPLEVAARAAAFLERASASPGVAREAQLLRARALEEAFWSAGGTDRSTLEAALAAWRDVASRAGAPPEAAERVAALSGSQPSDAGSRPVCQ